MVLRILKGDLMGSKALAKLLPTHAPVSTSGAPSSSSSLSLAKVIRSDENLTAMLPDAAAAGDVPCVTVSMPLQGASE